MQASHQKNWLTGRYAVQEVLRAGTWPVAELFLSDDLKNPEWHDVQSLAEAEEIPLQRVSRDRLTELCGSDHHQGFAARMTEYPYLSVAALLERIPKFEAAREQPNIPILVICDRLQDTFNFGAILRCCDAMNVAGVVIGEQEQAGVTPQVARSSSGAVNYVPVAVSPDLVAATHTIQEAGFCLAAASEKSTAAAWTSNLSKPVALIIGSEAHGISNELLQLCTEHLRIPMLGRVASLNAAVAAGILLYEIRRQQLALFRDFDQSIDR